MSRRRYWKRRQRPFDWVLIDAPHVGLMPDASLLARLTNAGLFVIAAGSTPYASLDRAIADIGRDFIVVTVLNRVEEHSLPSAGYYGSYYFPDQTDRCSPLEASNGPATNN